MSFEYITDKENKVKLTDDDITRLADKIASDFDNYNSRRTDNLDMATELTNEIFFKNKKLDASKSKDKYENWKTKINMAKTFMFYQTLKAFIWKNVYSSTNSMFNVSGENQEADNDSNKQKSNLVNIFEKMKFQNTCDKVLDYALLYGELISFTGWKKRTQEFRRAIKPTDLANPKALKALASGKLHFIDEKEVYNNPFTTPVNPANFVFDASQKDNWDDCPKIYRSFVVPEDVINNKYYKIDKETAQAIRKEVDGTIEPTSSQKDDDLTQKTSNGNTVEVLEHWGNYTMKDGTVLKNWHIVVVARKFVVRFEKNTRITNPFSYCNCIEDPETKRGISYIYCVSPLARLQEILMERTCDLQALNENPPLYAPKGFFDEEDIKLYPGKIIEFGDNLTPSEIQPMQFNASIFLNDITFLADIMAEVSGVFPNMAGADEARSKTATEISTKAQGQLTRLSMIIDTINQGFIIPVVEKVAKLCADFKSGEEQIFVTNANDKETITIDDRIRQAEYRYTYADRSATTERSNKADLIVSACERFSQFIPLNAPELFTWYMEQKDVDNPERFIQPQVQMPQELQEAFMQDPEVQQMAQMVEQAKELNGNNKQPANVIPDASIPQAGANTLE